ncbi:MAG: alpha-L-fucosidase [Candidatus Omnitrophica bacterium]|nr:alpha-L-fucosidase [Candidatus Omnitrophota bacterium]
MNARLCVMTIVLKLVSNSLLLAAEVGISREQEEHIIRQAARVTPSPGELAWLETEFNAFIHFTVNTFTDREWGDGKEDPKVFNPTDFDARQWIQVFKDAGMKMVVLTAKHHDGFCLWPSQFTEHSVKNSPWRNGKGDVVREVSDACRELGLKFGLYLSPWDRHESSYGDSPRYNEYYKNQLRELLTHYGDIHEIWFDGACAEGPNGKMQIYDIDGFVGLIRTLQPRAVIVGVDGYAKDESGYGRETEWMAVPRFVQADGSLYEPRNVGQALAYINQPNFGSRQFILDAVTRHRYPFDWWVSENIVSIRPGWFYHASEDDKVKSLEKLLDIYYCSVGRNGPLLLNVPPDRRGRIHETDAQRLRDLGKVLQATFARNLARGAASRASQVRDGNAAYGAANTLDGDSHTYWMADDGVSTAWLEYDLGQAQVFNRVVLQEFVQRGQRVEEFAVETWDGQRWNEVAHGSTIGYKRILRTADVKATKVRVNILRSRVCPTLSTFGLYFAPPAGDVLRQ